MSRCTLGTKLTLWSALIVTVALLASALTSDIFVYRTERRELDQELHQAAHHFFEQHQTHGAKVDWLISRGVEEVFSPHDRNRFVLIRSADGRAVYSSPNMPAGLDFPTGSGMYNARIGETKVRLGVFRERGLTLYLAGNTAEFTELIAELAIGHLVALPFVIAVVALGGWWLGLQALRPVKAMADAAGSIQPEELGRRLPQPIQADEIGRLARVFNEMLDRLQRGFQQATRFSTDASHELRTPLAVLRASVEDLLEDPTLTEPQRDAVAELQFQTQRLISITNTLLLLARADGGRLSLQLEDADLRDLMLDCFEDARILGEQHGVRVECQFDTPGLVRVEPLRVRQTLLNLLENAVKYNVPDGRVEMRLTVAGGWCRVRVGNTGPEIPAAEQVGLFERFFRAGRWEDTPGSGLGLSLARELARGHAGDVVLLSSREGWTEFELSLPMRPSSGTPVTSTAMAAANS
jgi:signal transduction histidine kinase